MLHTGHVDEVFFGKEVLTEWEATLRALIAQVPPKGEADPNPLEK